MERGRGKPRRGGGGRRPYRGRGSGGDREYSHRGNRDFTRDRRRSPEPEKEEGNDVAGHQENEEQSSEFSRRKILSNWDRYEATEKETESEVQQRGTEYSVLLTSAVPVSLRYLQFLALCQTEISGDPLHPQSA
ncbi:hypothetical protein GDO81_015095 [Engystomops pustulosus]|uniref:Cell death regulator Aven n=1 Tax=Engystomops pustulosus TaxID=76066 RepID=A0AAV7AH67_ENGPU|nr:hypothetical protein GDO81_015095 [Engystomops pustulosus]